MAPTPSKPKYDESHNKCDHYHDMDICYNGDDVLDDDNEDDDRKMPALEHPRSYDDDEDSLSDEDDDDENLYDGDDLSDVSNVSKPKPFPVLANYDKNFIQDLSDLSIGHRENNAPEVNAPHAATAVVSHLPPPPPAAPFLMPVPPSAHNEDSDSQIPTAALPPAGTIAAARIHNACRMLEEARENARKEKRHIEYNKKRARIRKIKQTQHQGHSRQDAIKTSNQWKQIHTK
jgi:hypothetical protein